jgi:hypothetical protein
MTDKIHPSASAEPNSGVSIGDIDGGIHRAVIAGRQVIADIINTGDHNQFFLGNYEHLRDVYIEPWPVFERVALDLFEGREWLLAKVDAFLRSRDRGYFILEAEAGLGKTTFLAWLVRQRGYIHHFTELTPGLEGIEAGLKNLVAQLMLAYDLNTPEAKGMLPSVAARPEYLLKLLKQASDQRREDEKIVLVIDALDESDAPLNQNVLGLPRVLPEGVFFIVSQGPVPVALDVEPPELRERFCFTADSADNQADMRRFLERAAAWPGVARALRENDYTTTQFVTTLLDKCQGLWIYLHYVVHEIESQRSSRVNLEALPEGMTQYYARHWRRWRDAEEAQWYGTYLPLLSTLAAARVALTVERLAEWANVNMPELILRRLLNERWRPFLAVAGREVQTRYRFYHASLQEFFDGRVRREQLTVAEEALVEELATATRNTHYRLAERYLTAWGSLQAGLPRLAETAQRELDEGYGLRYIAAHLEAAGRTEDLHWLLTLETHEQRNVWYEIKDASGEAAGYSADITRAWNLAAKESAQQLVASGQAPGIGLQVRYALLTSSVSSLAESLPPALLTALVATGQWSPQQGLAYARRMSSLHGKRAQALARLAPLLPPTLQREILEDTWAGKLDLPEVSLRVLVGGLPTPVLRELFDATNNNPSTRYRSHALTCLAPHLPDPERGQALKAILECWREVTDTFRLSYVLTPLAALFPEPDGTAVQQQILQLWEPEPAERWVSNLLALVRDLMIEALPFLKTELELWERINRDLFPIDDIAAMSPEEFQRWLFRESPADRPAVLNARSRGNFLLLYLGQLAPTFTALLAHHFDCDVPQLGPLGRVHYPSYKGHISPEGVISPAGADDRLLDWAFGGPGAVPRPAQEQADWVFVQCLDWLGSPLRKTLVDPALKRAQTIGDSFIRLQALARVLSSVEMPMRDNLRMHALQDAAEIERIPDRIRAVSRLVPAIPQGLASEALRWVKGSKEEEERTKVLREILSCLPSALWDEALSVVRELKDLGRRVRLYAFMLSGNTVPGKAAILAQATADAWSLASPEDQARAFASLVPHLQDADLEGVLSLAEKTKDRDAVEELLEALSPRLPADSLLKALEIARGIRDKEQRSEALEAIALRLLAGGDHEEALWTARAIPDELMRAAVLAELARVLPARLRANLQKEALEVARQVPLHSAWSRADGSVECRTAILRQIAHQLHPRMRVAVLKEALEDEFRLEPKQRHLPVLADLGGDLAKLGHQDDALRVAEAVYNSAGWRDESPMQGPYDPLRVAQAFAGEAHETSFWRVWTLTQLAACFHEPKRTELLTEALEIALAIADSTFPVGVAPETERDRTLAFLAPRLQKDLPQEAQRAYRAIRGTTKRTEALIGRAQYLPEAQRREALETARQMALEVEGRDAAWLLATLLQALPASARRKVVREGLPKALQINDEQERAEALVHLSPYLDKAAVRTTCSAAARVADPHWQGRLRYYLARRLAELHEVDWALETVLASESSYWKASGIAYLRPYLDEPSRLTALRVMVELAMDLVKRTDEFGSPPRELIRSWVGWAFPVSIFDDLAPHLSQPLLRDFYPTAEWYLRQISTIGRSDCCRELSHLPSFLMALGGTKALMEVARAIQDSGTWWP